MIRSFYLGLAGTGKKRLFSGKVLTRLFVSIAILALLIAWLSADDLLSAIAAIPVGIWLLVFTAFVIGHIVSAFKWRWMMRATGIDIRPALSIRAHFAGLFANLFLPSIVGGDVVRAAMVMREQRSDSAAIALGSLADRLNDVLALIIIASIAAVLMGANQYQVHSEFLAGLVIVLFACGLAGVLILRLVPKSALPAFLHGILDKLNRALDSLIRNPVIALRCLLMSLVIQGSFVGLNVVIANAMAIDATVPVWMFAWPMAKLVALAPVSFGGIGVREVALAGILAPFGVETSLAVAQSLSWEIVLLVTGLVSGFTVAMMTSKKTVIE